MDRQPHLNVTVDLVKGISPVAAAKVVTPATELPIDSSNQFGQGTVLVVTLVKQRNASFCRCTALAEGLRLYIFVPG
ncbi:MAG TPA: hypothetical protein VGY56_11190 [Verrucomicrobiae bacterium]|nr:hypothetical protein [Verrucomicrobiae bacterium]